MNPRFDALRIFAKRSRCLPACSAGISSEQFGKLVFNRTTMQKMLPKEIFRNVVDAIDKREKIKPEYADTIAVAMKEWAMERGASHYTHWFHPLTGGSAEKHDAFIDWNNPDQVIEKFSGKQLIQGEPDASSFPSGGLRSTYEARGYTGWDPSSPVFLWEGGDGTTLCIPCIFFSWTGDVLDSKIPLLRSDKAINDAVLRLLKLTGIKADYVYSTLGSEQEYFVIDRVWRNLRPDLVLHGRTVFGAPSPKGQELQDHYFGSVKDRILAFMRDFEEAALRLGIPVKTRHNEVAPAQHEVAPVFERASIAIDHNIILMELMRQTALTHDLSCLLHEKPFKGLNGSGKHCNWSLSTDTGINLLDPTDTPENNIHFLVLLVAIIDAIYRHSALLRASIGSASNDCRLGGHEAPPAIMSIYLGREISGVLENLEKTGTHQSQKGKNQYDFGLSGLPDLTKDSTDRNRTSPFAFTGNKFEFRAVGSSANPSFPIMVLNAIVAESVNRIVDEIEQKLGNKNPDIKEVAAAFVPILPKYLKESKKVIFNGDNYSKEWVAEAKERGLPMLEKSVEAFNYLEADSTVQAFKGILNKGELSSRHEILLELYAHNISIEANLMLDIFHSQILPAAIQQQHVLASSIQKTRETLGEEAPLTAQLDLLRKINQKIESALKVAKSLSEEKKQIDQIESISQRAKPCCHTLIPLCDELREIADELEILTDDKLWPLPKYREMLFLV